jgi:hypothetical protein
VLFVEGEHGVHEVVYTIRIDESEEGMGSTEGVPKGEYCVLSITFGGMDFPVCAPVSAVHVLKEDGREAGPV